MMKLFGARSAVRWIAGGLLGLTAIIQAFRALVNLPGGLSSLGGLAIMLLALLTAFGFVELLRARLRIGRELLAMSARPPSGTLIEARRTRLLQIASIGGRPDATALAERAAAEERGHAYLGRYLVAVAVLIGLVGTFSGLAQALRSLPSILAGADAQLLPQLLAAPLAGLDLVFAAGVVGILSTLALALVQGDLQLHEEQALARLEDETTHELIPTLWPKAHTTEDRMLRELSLLRSENSALAAAQTRTADAFATHSVEAARLLSGASERASQLLVGKLTTTLEGRTQQIAAELAGGTAAQIALAEELRAQAMTHRAELQASVGLMAAQLAAVHGEIGSQAEATQHLLVHAAERQAQDAALAWKALRDELRTSLEATRVTLASSFERASTAVETAARSAVDALADSTQASIGSLEETARAIAHGADQGLLASRTALVETADSACDSLALAVRESVDHLGDLMARGRVDLEETLAAHRLAVDHFVEGAIGSLAGSAVELARAASSLAETHQGLAPELSALTPELRGLTQEVALLGARTSDDHEQPLFADELLRLGEGMSRLETLVRLSHGRDQGAQS